MKRLGSAGIANAKQRQMRLTGRIYHLGKIRRYTTSFFVHHAQRLSAACSSVTGVWVEGLQVAWYGSRARRGEYPRSRLALDETILTSGAVLVMVPSGT